jgi:REP element-mobilizing transposase RayT
MAHTYTNILIHALFSAKDRQFWLIPEIREEVFRYLGGTLNELRGQSLLVNGPRDHVHMLFDQPRTLSIATVMEKVNANSSGWVKERWPERRYFGRQAGYAAFSVSKSHVEQVKRYISNQEEHHRKVTFQEELVAFLKKHGIEYDPRYVFD